MSIQKLHLLRSGSKRIIQRFIELLPPCIYLCKWWTCKHVIDRDAWHMSALYKNILRCSCTIQLLRVQLYTIGSIWGFALAIGAWSALWTQKPCTCANHKLLFYTKISVYIGNNFFSITAGSRVVLCRHRGCSGSAHSKMYGFQKRRKEVLHFPLQTFPSFQYMASTATCRVLSALTCGVKV